MNKCTQCGKDTVWVSCYNWNFDKKEWDLELCKDCDKKHRKVRKDEMQGL